MKRPKIILSIAERDSAFDEAEKILAAQNCDVETVDLKNYSLAGADIFIGKTMKKSKLDGADRLNAVFAYKTGVDDFPTAEFAERGIRLFNSHINSRYIAEYAFSLGAALVSRIAEFDRKMRGGDWCGDNPWWHSIFSMRAGLVGYGHIGREIANILRKNGIACATLDRGKDYSGVTAVPTLLDLIDCSDILFFSLPKTAETDKIVNAETLSRMRGKFIVNVGRSNCIDEPALYDALKAGAIGGAAIDTWREKPKTKTARLLPFDVPFDGLDNILLSSHKAMQLADGHDRYVKDTVQKVLDYLDGKTVEGEVDCTRGY